MISKKAANIAAYTAGEQPQDKKYIKLNTNENPYPPSDKVISALKGADFSRLRLYPDPESTVLRNAAAKEFSLKPENVFCGNGSDEILAFCFQAFYDNHPALDTFLRKDVGYPSTEGNPSAVNSLKYIYFPNITYSFYPVWCNLFDIPFKTIPVCQHFAINPDDFLNLQDSQGVVLANPNALTGRALPLNDIERIVAANKNNAVIIDEAYIDFGGESAVPLIKKYENLCVVKTFSKGYSLAGMRAGFALASEKLIGALRKIRDSFNSYPLDMLAQTAAAAALADKEYFQAQATKIIDTRERFVKAIESLGFYVVPSCANFIFASHKTVKAETLYLKLKEAGVLVRWWGKPLIDNFLRITIGTDEEMQECEGRICEILKTNTPP